MIDFGPEFDWLKTLKSLSSGRNSGTDLQTLKRMAGQWLTCACGQLCKELPRNIICGPEDHILYSRGIEFTKYVAEENWDTAIKIFEEIEHRAALLLSEITKNKKETNGDNSE